MAPGLLGGRRQQQRLPGVSGLLRVLLADSDPDRGAVLEQRLRDIGDAVILRVPGGRRLADTVRELAADVLVVDMPLPDRDRLDELRQIGADGPRPIVMFVGRDDGSFMEAAIAAGVSSYNVVGTAFPDAAPIVLAAVAIFHKHQRLADELRAAKATLVERDTINRAKSLLMRRRHIDEPQAYRWLRRQAMNRSRRLADIAAELLAGEETVPK